MPEKKETFATYAEFWPYYLGQHKKRATRTWHVAGTLLALLGCIAAIVCFMPMWFLAAYLVGYGVAWLAHSFIEHNHPATFQYPIWSLRGDLHMLGLWLTGRLEAELIRCNIIG